MSDAIVVSSDPVTLVGGGHACVEELSEALTLAPVCVAVDGGAGLALQADVFIEALIGDLDSISPAQLSQIPPDRQFRINEQETTDFDKALRLVDAPLMIAVGFTGGRIDHQLAAFHALAKAAHVPCILLARNEIILLAPPEIAVPTQAGDVVSIVPLAPMTGTSTGLEWPIDGLALDPLTRIGTSNRATGPMTLTCDSPHGLLILPRRLIRQVAASLRAPDAAGWPPRLAQ